MSSAATAVRTAARAATSTATLIVRNRVACIFLEVRLADLRVAGAPTSNEHGKTPAITRGSPATRRPELLRPAPVPAVWGAHHAAGGRDTPQQSRRHHSH